MVSTLEIINKKKAKTIINWLFSYQISLTKINVHTQNVCTHGYTYTQTHTTRHLTDHEMLSIYYNKN